MPPKYPDGVTEKITLPIRITINPLRFRRYEYVCRPLPIKPNKLGAPDDGKAVDRRTLRGYDATEEVLIPRVRQRAKSHKGTYPDDFANFRVPEGWGQAISDFMATHQLNHADILRYAFGFSVFTNTEVFEEYIHNTEL